MFVVSYLIPAYQWTETHGNLLGRFAASVNCFQGACRSCIKRFRVTFLMSSAWCFSFPILFQTICCLQSFGRIFFRWWFQLFTRFTAFFSYVDRATKLAKRAHEHYRRKVCIVCVSWSDDHFAPVQVGFLGMSRQQRNGTHQSQTMFYRTDCANHSTR